MDTATNFSCDKNFIKQYNNPEMKKLLEIARSPTNFYNVFRVNLTSLMQIKKILNSEESEATSKLSELELLTYLLWLSSGASFKVTSELTGLHISYLENLIDSMIQRFSVASTGVIFCPKDKTDLSNGMVNITSSHIFGLAFGYLDTFLIKIPKPEDNPEEYMSSDNDYSIQAQVVCNYRGKITDLALGFPSQMSKQEILCSTPLFSENSLLSDGQVLLCGKGYPCLLSPTCLIPPMEEDDDILTKTFNSHMDSIHSVLDKSIGQMFGRWSNIFAKPPDMSLDMFKNVVLSCVMMHNICLEVEDSWPEQLPVCFSQNCSVTVNEDFTSGENTRLQMAAQLFPDYINCDDEDESNFFTPCEDIYDEVQDGENLMRPEDVKEEDTSGNTLIPSVN